jgi:hypothetical protein
MAYFETINLVQGDTKPQINFTIRDSATAVNNSTVLDADDPSTWKIIDITEHSIELKFKEMNSAAVLSTINLGKTTPAEGTCYLNWPADSLDVPAGIYEGELQLTDGSGKVQTVYDKLKFKVREQF